MRLSETILGIVFIIFGGVVFYSSSLLPPVRHIDFGPGFLPSIVAVGMMICGLLLVLRDLVANRRLVFAVEFTEWRHSPGGIGTLVSVAAAMAMYPAAISGLGFALATAPFLLILLKAGKMAWLPALAIAVLGALLCHITFVELLRVQLPWGVLTPYSSLLSLR